MPFTPWSIILLASDSSSRQVEMKKLTLKVIKEAILTLEATNDSSLEAIKQHLDQVLGKETTFYALSTPIQNMLLKKEIKQDGDGNFKYIEGTAEQSSSNRRSSSRLRNKQTQNNDTGSTCRGPGPTSSNYFSDAIIEKYITIRPNWKVNSEYAVSDVVYLLDGTEKGIGVEVKVARPNSVSEEGKFNTYQLNFCKNDRKDTPCIFLCVKKYEDESGLLEFDKVLVFDEFFLHSQYTYTTETDYQGKKKRAKRKRTTHDPRGTFDSLDRALQFIEETYSHRAKAVCDLEWEFPGDSNFLNHAKLKSLLSFKEFKNIEYVNDTRRYQIDAVCEGRRIQVKAARLLEKKTKPKICADLENSYEKEKVDAFVIVYYEYKKGLVHVWDFKRDDISPIHLQRFYGSRSMLELRFDGCGTQESSAYDSNHKWTEQFYLGASPFTEEVKKRIEERTFKTKNIAPNMKELKEFWEKEKSREIAASVLTSQFSLT